MIGQDVEILEDLHWMTFAVKLCGAVLNGRTSYLFLKEISVTLIK